MLRLLIYHIFEHSLRLKEYENDLFIYYGR